MGLCKCPKKKVTNLFCFEHRVNVCEHCLVANHPKCIVQSYLQWLQDSDYNPLCSLCNNGLTDEEDCGECVRLVCYDVFHWDCLNQYASQMPSNTAPAGYTCPTCKHGLFPPANLMSPVAEALRQMLTKVNWARAGLGLPLIKEESPVVPSKQSSVLSSTASSFSAPPLAVHSSPSQSLPSVHSQAEAKKPLPQSGNSNTPQYTRPSAQVSPYTSTPITASQTGPSHSVINVDAGTTARGDKGMLTSPRKLFDSTKDDVLNMSHDHDEDKYRRRPALSWLGRLFKTTEGRKTRDPNATKKKFMMVIIIGLIGFITVVMIFSRLGHMATQDDPAFNPLANPNIHVNERQAPILKNPAVPILQNKLSH